MRLPGCGEKMRDPSEVIVLLQRYLVFFRQRQRQAGRRHEFELREAIPRVIHDGIENQIESAEVSADDGTDLGGVGSFVPMSGIEAEFEIDAVEELALVRVGRGEQGPKLHSIV